MRQFHLSAAVIIAALSAMPTVTAQTSLVKPKIDPDPCSKTNPTARDDMLACGREAAYHRFYDVAFKWYMKAANLSSLEAAYRIAQQYENGNGVPQDFVLAYMWLDITAAFDGKCLGDNQSEIYEREAIAKHLNGSQAVKAQNMSRQFLSQHEQDCTADPPNPIDPLYR